MSAPDEQFITQLTDAVAEVNAYRAEMTPVAGNP